MKKINLSKQNDNACAPNIGRQEEFLERYTVIQYPSFHRVMIGVFYIEFSALHCHGTCYDRRFLNLP